MSPDFLIKSYLKFIKADNNNLKFEFVKYKDSNGVNYEITCYSKNEDKIYILKNENEIKEFLKFLNKNKKNNKNILKNLVYLKKILMLIKDFEFFSMKEEGYKKTKKIKSVRVLYCPEKYYTENSPRKCTFEFTIEPVGHIKKRGHLMYPATKLNYEILINKENFNLIVNFLTKKEYKKLLEVIYKNKEKEKKELEGLEDIVKEVLNKIGLQ